MKRLFAIGVLGLLFAACGSDHEAELHAALLGTWHSDKAATLAEIDVIGGFSSRVRSGFEQTLGRRTLTYTHGRVTAQLDGGAGASALTASNPYRVVEARGRELVIEGYDHELAERVEQVVVLEGDLLWFWRDGGRWREVYRRVPPVSAPPSPTP